MNQGKRFLAFILRSIALTYLLFIVELGLLIIVESILFNIKYPEGSVFAQLPIILKNVFAWTIVLRTIYGYSVVLTAVFILLYHKKIKFSPMRVSLACVGSFLLVSLLYAFLIIPGTKELMVFEFGYGHSYFYYTIVFLFIAPFLLNKMGVFRYFVLT